MITVLFRTRPSKTGYSISEDQIYDFSNSRAYRQNLNNRAWRPATDISETEDKIIVLVEIAGMTEDDFSIVMDHSILTIQGVRKPPVEDRRSIHQMEIPFGEFTVEIMFRTEVDIEKVSASYENGFLQIVLPKATPHRIDLTQE